MTGRSKSCPTIRRWYIHVYTTSCSVLLDKHEFLWLFRKGSPLSIVALLGHYWSLIHVISLPQPVFSQCKGTLPPSTRNKVLNRCFWTTSLPSGTLWFTVLRIGSWPRKTLGVSSGHDLLADTFAASGTNSRSTSARLWYLFEATRFGASGQRPLAKAHTFFFGGRTGKRSGRFILS